MGMGELLVILAVALLVLGPKRLPEVASGLGKAIREFKKATRDIQSNLESDETVKKPLQELKAALRDDPLPAPAIASPMATIPAGGPRPAAAAASGESTRVILTPETATLTPATVTLTPAAPGPGALGTTKETKA